MGVYRVTMNTDYHGKVFLWYLGVNGLILLIVRDPDTIKLLFAMAGGWWMGSWFHEPSRTELSSPKSRPQ